jgi:hypothetical protein
VLLAAMAFAASAAKAPETPVSVLSDLSGALSNNNPAGALSAFDHQMRSYGTIEQNVVAITAQDDVTSAIDVVSDEEAAGVHKLDLDWLLRLISRTDPNLLESRRVRVNVEMRQIKGRWKITAMEPVSILDPLRVR